MNAEDGVTLRPVEIRRGIGEAGGQPPRGPARAPRTPARGRGRAAVDAAESYGLIVLFMAAVALFSILCPQTFAASANFRSIAVSGAVLAVAAIALVIPLVAGRFDISVGANLGLSSIVCATLMSDHHLPLVLAVIGGVVAGAIIGAVNGFLVAYLGVNSIIGTLGMSIVLGGVVEAYTGGTPISTGLSAGLVNLSLQDFAGIPVLFLLMLVIAAGAWFILRQTPYGRYLQGVGSNINAAKLTGIPVRLIVFGSFVLGGVLAGIAGVLQIAAQGNADPSVGTITFILPALAAAFLGATTWRPGTYNVVGTVIALYFLETVVSGLSLLGAAPWVTDIFNGAAVIVAVVLSAYLRRQRTGNTEVGS
jgi:ribose transport system permease protein